MPDFSYCRYLPRWTVVWIVNSTILYHLLYPPCVCRSCLACCYILQKASQLLIVYLFKRLGVLNIIFFASFTNMRVSALSLLIITSGIHAATENNSQRSSTAKDVSGSYRIYTARMQKWLKE